MLLVSYKKFQTRKTLSFKKVDFKKQGFHLLLKPRMNESVVRVCFVLHSIEKSFHLMITTVAANYTVITTSNTYL